MLNLINENCLECSLSSRNVTITCKAFFMLQISKYVNSTFVELVEEDECRMHFSMAAIVAYVTGSK